MIRAKTNGKLLETSPSIDVEGLVNRLRQQAKSRNPEPPQSDGLAESDPSAGALAKQAELNHGLVMVMGSMLRHLETLEERFVHLEAKVDAMELRIEAALANPAGMSKEVSAELDEIRQRFGQMSALLEQRDLLAYKQLAKIKREADAQIRRTADDLEEARRQVVQATHQSVNLGGRVESLADAIEEVKISIANLDSRSAQIEFNPVQHATEESAQFREQDDRIE